MISIYYVRHDHNVVVYDVSDNINNLVCVIFR